MRIIRHPKRSEWPAILARPTFDATEIDESVRKILASVRNGGDAALRGLTKLHDGIEISHLAVSDQEFNDAAERVPAELKAAIEKAKANIYKFHLSQTNERRIVETTPGVHCWRRSVAIERVGIYVPAGTAPLFSTVLMLAVPAGIAGCSEIILCTPPDRDGSINDAILYTAQLCGVTKVFKAGGAQAIAAMAYGTESIPRVSKIFGPGNLYVTHAKQIVSAEVAIDLPAGPSELAILADTTCNPAFVAADLLSQAEHGSDSQVLLVSADESVIIDTLLHLEQQLRSLPRREVASSSLTHSQAILVSTTNEFSNTLRTQLLESYLPDETVQ